MITYDCGISVGYVETEKSRDVGSGKIKGSWFPCGSKFSEIQSNFRKSEKKDGGGER